jgi:hypothetical protein
MTHKDVPYGAVVNFNQSDKGPLEIQFVVQQEGVYWLYNLGSQTGRPLIDFGLTLSTTLASVGDGDSDDSGNSTVAED